MTTYYGPQDGFRPPPAYPAPQPAPPRTAPLLGIASLIISSLALLGVVGLILVVLLTFLGVAVDDEDSDYSYAGGGGIVTGQLDTRPAGTVTGTELVRELTATLVATGSAVEQLECPDTPSVKQGVVTICHGTVDDEPWALAIFFEDLAGAYTVDFI